MVDTSVKSNKKIISLDKFAGKWVAFVDGKIVGVENSLPELMKQVKKRKFQKNLRFCWFHEKTRDRIFCFYESRISLF